MFHEDRAGKHVRARAQCAPGGRCDPLAALDLRAIPGPLAGLLDAAASVLIAWDFLDADPEGVVGVGVVNLLAQGAVQETRLHVPLMRLPRRQRLAHAASRRRTGTGRDAHEEVDNH